MGIKAKRVKNLFVTLFFSSLMVFGIISMMSNAYNDIEDLNKYEGIITEKGITSNTSNVSGRGTVTSQVFYIKLNGLDQILGIYNIEQSYHSLDSKLNVNDIVRVYFINSPYNDRPNLNTYQIEKGDEIILGQQEFKRKELIGGIICIFGLALMIGIGYYQDKKLRPKKHNKNYVSQQSA